MFKLNNFGVILFASFSIKNCSMFIYENLKNRCKKSIFPQKIQKSLCITTKSLYTNSKFQTQLSRKLQRFRTCRKNKKCSIFHDLSEYIIFHMVVKLPFFQITAVDISVNQGYASHIYKTSIFVDEGQKNPVYKCILKIPTTDCFNELLDNMYGEEQQANVFV